MSDSQFGSLTFSLALVVVRSVCAFLAQQVLSHAMFLAFVNVAAFLVSGALGWVAIDRITGEEN